MLQKTKETDLVMMTDREDQTMAVVAETTDLVVVIIEIDLTIREETTEDKAAEETIIIEVAMIKMTIIVDHQTLTIDMITEETIVMTNITIIPKDSHLDSTTETLHSHTKILIITNNSNQVFILKMIKENLRKSYIIL